MKSTASLVTLNRWPLVSSRALYLQAAKELRTNAGQWEAANGAKFDLKSNLLRPAGWTSGDAAGLPMFPALPRFDECERGEIEHALRIVVKRTRAEYIYPARHYASVPYSTDPTVPAMGQRLLFAGEGILPVRQHLIGLLQRLGARRGASREEAEIEGHRLAELGEARVHRRGEPARVHQHRERLGEPLENLPQVRDQLPPRRSLCPQLVYDHSVGGYVLADGLD